MSLLDILIQFNNAALDKIAADAQSRAAVAIERGQQARSDRAVAHMQSLSSQLAYATDEAQIEAIRARMDQWTTFGGIAGGFYDDYGVWIADYGLD